MSTRKEQFAVADGVRLEISTFSGDILLTQGEAGTVAVTLDGSPGRFIVEQRGDTIVVEPQSGRRIGGSTDITAVVPAGARVQLKCTSGDIRVEAPVSSLGASVASGDIKAATVAGDASIKSASGDAMLDTVGGSLSVATASGDVRVGTVAGDLHITAASGDAVVESVAGAARVRTASGDVRIRRFDGPDLIAKTISGDLVVGIPANRRIDVDLQSLSGSLRNRLRSGDGSPPEKSIALRVKSVSGDLTLTSA